MIGRSPRFLQALALIERMARFDAPVLIQGETGTGKELAARAIHYQSPRRHAPFVALNCGALPEALIESELFGVERGAFTDARQARSGLVAAAEGGTLFLDELDSLPLRAQVSLLRFLQDFTYRPVGGTRECSGDVRIIAAANPRFDQLLRSGSFRDDLAFRLNVLLLAMPPLRERPGDAALLAEHFIARHAGHYGMPPRKLHPGSLAWMARHPWPGNVRELDNRVQRALLLSDDERLQLDPAAMAPAPTQDAPRVTPSGARCAALAGYHEAREQALQQFERQYLEQLMAAADGNVTQAARLAGKERRCLGKLLKKHGLQRASGAAAQPH
ncbi:MAG: sigma 54-interacting transcriptional regulator [Burkholderiaceae bacterium]|nr:sigma 54-interacting transcriptional regulator [Burkholderiaceae bacterium]